MGELGQIIRGVGEERIKVCLDTQHAFASGYDLRTENGVEKFVQEIKEEVGLEKVVAIHANDSKTDLNSHRDRHENIGEGLISLEGFKNIINHPALRNIPFVLEVPGLRSEEEARQNIQTLKSLL